MNQVDRPERPHVTRIAGHATAIRRFGTGPRPGLALHCSLAHGGAWAPLAQLLPGLSLTAPDLPGHGESAPPAGDHTDPATGERLHRLSTDIAAELAGRIGAGGPVDVLGHSFGGTVALRLALEHPDLVGSLTLVEPVLFAAAKGSAAFQDNLAAQERVAAVQAQDPAAAAALFHAEWGGGIPFAALPERQRLYMTDRLWLVTSVGTVLMEDKAEMLAPGRLEALSVPVLLVEGCQSPPVVAAIHATLAARIPGARRLREEGAAHMVPITHPAPVAAAVAELMTDA